MDLGEVALLPGLVNAHCHLDYTDMAGQLVPPKSFTDWIKSITELRSAGAVRISFAPAHGRGRCCWRPGITVVGDVESAPDLLPAMWEATALRIVSFVELTASRADANLGPSSKKRSLPSPPCPAAASGPSSRRTLPYSTTPELLRRCGATTRRRHWASPPTSPNRLKSTRCSRTAAGLCSPGWRATSATCRIAAASRRSNTWRGQHLLGEHLLAVHANYLARGDALAGTTPCPCGPLPSQPCLFRPSSFPCHRVAAAGVNVCLGTDSLATVLTRRRQPIALDLFAEMRAFAQAYPALSPGLILRMATVNGARALALPGPSR